MTISLLVITVNFASHPWNYQKKKILRRKLNFEIRRIWYRWQNFFWVCISGVNITHTLLPSVEILLILVKQHLHLCPTGDFFLKNGLLNTFLCYNKNWFDGYKRTLSKFVSRDFRKKENFHTESTSTFGLSLFIPGMYDLPEIVIFKSLAPINALLTIDVRALPLTMCLLPSMHIL